MKTISRIAAILSVLIPLSCTREELRPNEPQTLPVGTPVTLNIGFNAPQRHDVKIATRAEATREDESRVHDLYVMLFDDDNSGEKFYGRYFTYEHEIHSLSDLDSHSNEGWYVENSDNSIGVVKIATESRENCTIVMLANVTNAITTLNDQDPIDVLSRISSMEDLMDVKVTLEQQVINRGDLFLMMATKTGVNTGDLKWGEFVDDDDDDETPDVPSYNKHDGNYQLKLWPLDAKVKFCISYNETNINPAKSEARKWWVYNLPSQCYLMPQNGLPSDIEYFASEQAYFEGTETINGKEWEVFSFYMLENHQSPRQSIMSLPEPSYYYRETETDASLDEPNFIYAPEHGTFVKFDMLLGLKEEGVSDIVRDNDFAKALTTEATYSVHLGNFLNSDGRSTPDADWDKYDVERSTSYTYFITINNSRSIYLEVIGENGNPPAEVQAGQEGSLLLSTDDIVNCDAHYEYRCLTFRYTPALEGKKVSWFVKTPFDEGGAQWIPELNNWKFECKDFLWVKFAINSIGGTGAYSHDRVPYPGATYNPAWKHDRDPIAANQLLDIHQLYNYILDQTKIRNAWLEAKASGSNADYDGDFRLDPDLSTGVSDDGSTDYVDESHEYTIRVTAFVDEYYYEKDPRLDPETAPADPNLWRKFVNADPRELHILSEAVYSDDDQSDVITSSHSIIQQSIQTFYNTYSPDLQTLWGTEHIDEMEYRVRKQKDDGQAIWPWWPFTGDDVSARDLPSGLPAPTSNENGRLNSASIWGVASKASWDEATAPEWGTMLDYSTDNNTPELQDDYHYLAYSCLTRNRDNNGNGKIDPDEVRWYTAAIDQLVGMWVGNESLSPSARVYQPENKNDITDGRKWRSWVASSTVGNGGITNPRTLRSEEGGTKSDYKSYSWPTNPSFDRTDRHRVSSVRCLRNIGTFISGGEITDISYSDLSQPIDKYYDSPAGFDANGRVRPNADGTYTLRFSRLEPRSLREFTSEDLPYHEEYSVHNKVYMELNMQNPANRAYTDGPAEEEGSIYHLHLDEEELNYEITTTGYNSFCPPGYRLPNMTELVLMSALQPTSYWTKDKLYPCRSHYSRGKIGKKITTGEDMKIGWGYQVKDDRVHLINEGTSLTGIRCVRDNNCTGEITGTISVDKADKLHLGDTTKIKLNFSSMASAIKTLSLNLVYVTPSGAEDTRAISTESIHLSGVSIQDQEIAWIVPDDLAMLGNMSVRAVVINNAGIKLVVEAPIRIISPVHVSIRLLPCEYNAETDDMDNPSFPILVTAYSPESAIKNWRLTVKDPDKEVANLSLAADPRDPNFWSAKFYYHYTMSSLMTGRYTFQLDVQTQDGVHTRSTVAAMDILKINYYPNPGITGVDYLEASDITNAWEPDKVEGVNFYSGDFIEANMDVTGCTYVSVANANRDRSIGRDDLISIGITDTDHKDSGMSLPYVYHIYYPAHDGVQDSGQDWLRPNIGKPSGDHSNGCNYKLFNGGDGTGFVLQSGSNYKPDRTKRQHFRLERNGAYWNNQWLDPSKWSAGGGDNDEAEACLNQILASDTFYIGSTQGYHRSRARYCFVRVVYNSSESNVAGGDVSFDHDPINGGNL